MQNLITKYGYLIVGVIVVIAIVVFFVNSRKPAVPSEADFKAQKIFWVNDETGEEVVLPGDELSPRVGADGKRTLVKAHKFTRDGGATVVIAYLEKYSDKAIAELPTADSEYRLHLEMNELLIRRPGSGQKWVPSNSPAADAIRSMPIPGEGQMQVVLPK
ncbi:MAG: hypothetical protein FWD53_08070 [Phycisphaerales bacterium]|nr:hypothetical protein [Phycisphaerales bacterium]